MMRRPAIDASNLHRDAALSFRHLVICLAFLTGIVPGLAHGASAGEEPFVSGAAYDRKIPPPEEVLGVPVGTRPATYDEITRYFRLLASSSRRAVYIYGLAMSDRPPKLPPAPSRTVVSPFGVYSYFSTTFSSGSVACVTDPSEFVW